jgi:phenylacetate-coenzyme A ligase PaaK-like adenylate-forming protein
MNNTSVGGNWRMVLTTENDIDMLTVEVETKQRLSEVESEKLSQKLKSDIQSVIVFTPRVDILPPNMIQETGLKAKRVIDNRKKD